MASLLRAASRTYNLAFRFPPGRGGRQFKRSLDTASTKEAKESKAVVERTIRLLKDGVLSLPVEEPTDDQLWQFLRSGGKLAELPTVKTRVRLADLSVAYFESVVGNEENTKATEKIHHDHLVRILKNAWIDEIDPAKLRKYIKAREAEPGLKGRTISGDTIRKELASFSTLWQFAESEGLVSGTNPQKKVKKPKSRKKPPFMTWAEIETRVARGGLTAADESELWDCLFLDEKQIGDFLRHLDKHTLLKGYRWIYPAICFCAYTGARRSEMMRALIDDVNGSVLIREKKGDKDHDVTFREVPLHPSLAAVLDQWLADHPGGQHLFCKPSGESLRRTVHKWWLLCTNRTKWENLRGFHVLRHSFASNLARRRVDDRVIRNLMGHRTEEMTERYRHLFPEQKETAVALLDY